MKTRGTRSICIMGVCCLVVLLSSCTSSDVVRLESSMPDKDGFQLRYSIVCVIHGDGDYLYHDSRGNALIADEEALAGAVKVAEENPYAEVFIFHEKPRRNFLLFFPLPDGEFYYYRNGKLVANESYSRDQGSSVPDNQGTLYHRFHKEDQPGLVRLFFYFGHEIPEVDGERYDASYPDRSFTVNELAKGLSRFDGDSVKFDILTISTCFNGTPHAIATLAPYAKYIIASPDNLHLSYFNLRPFANLDTGLRNRGVGEFAKQYAQQTFDRLSKDVQTVVTVAVYDVDCVQGFLRSVDSVDRATVTLKDEAITSTAAMEHCDCADIPAYTLPLMSEGVDVFYRPARFGREKYKQQHSGWGCWKKNELQSITSQNQETTQK